jgi:hypothetical protein
MPEDSRTDDVEKFLTEQKSMEDRKQALIADLLKQREAAIAAFDGKLAKLGYQGNSGKPRRSHHKTASKSSLDTPGTAKGKTKA